MYRGGWLAVALLLGCTEATDVPGGRDAAPPRIDGGRADGGSADGGGSPPDAAPPDGTSADPMDAAPPDGTPGDPMDAAPADQGPPPPDGAPADGGPGPTDAASADQGPPRPGEPWRLRGRVRWIAGEAGAGRVFGPTESTNGLLRLRGTLRAPAVGGLP